MFGKRKQYQYVSIRVISGAHQSSSCHTMNDNTLDRLSALLRFGCSVQLACKEVGVARTTFYRWLERIRDMRSNSCWEHASESCRVFVHIMDSSQHKIEDFESSAWELEGSAPVSLTLSPGDNVTLKPDALLSPPVSADNFVEIPDRLRKHFLSIMHYAIKNKIWRNKSWSNMTVAEKKSLRQLSNEITMCPTNVSEPLIFNWGGASVTKQFATYEFLQPCSIQLIIRYLRDRKYRARKKKRAQNDLGERGSSSGCVDDSEPVVFLEYNPVESGHNGARHFNCGGKQTLGDDCAIGVSDYQHHSMQLADNTWHWDGSKSSSEKQSKCQELVVETNMLPIFECLRELSPQISGDVMVVHHGRGNSVRWLLSNTGASSICALDWCPHVNEDASSLHLAHSAMNSSAVPVTVPGHAILPDHHVESNMYSTLFDVIIDTNVAVFNLNFPPFFPEKVRELPQVEQHLKNIRKLLRFGGLIALLCRSDSILNVVVLSLQSLGFDVIRTIRCLDAQQDSSTTTTLTDQEDWVVARKKCDC